MEESLQGDPEDNSKKIPSPLKKSKSFPGLSVHPLVSQAYGLLRVFKVAQYNLQLAGNRMDNLEGVGWGVKKVVFLPVCMLLIDRGKGKSSRTPTMVVLLQYY